MKKWSALKEAVPRDWDEGRVEHKEHGLRYDLPETCSMLVDGWGAWTRSSYPYRTEGPDDPPEGWQRRCRRGRSQGLVLFAGIPLCHRHYEELLLSIKSIVE